MKRIGIFSLVLLVLSVPVDGYSQARPPSFYIDKGACPFECCTYGNWKTKKTTSAYSLPNLRSKRVGRFVGGSNVLALTGEVHSVPSRFIVKKRHGKYRPGDVLWTYTNLGEGYVKIWFKGKWGQEELGVTPPPGQTCAQSRYCWGELMNEGNSTWWIKIKSADGWIGWTNEAENFCGTCEYNDCSGIGNATNDETASNESPSPELKPGDPLRPTSKKTNSIRSIDFKNFTYASQFCDEQFHIGNPVQLRDGGFTKGAELDEVFFAIKNVTYGDLTGDGTEEAVIQARCGLSGSSGPGSTEIFVFTFRDGRTELLTELNDLRISSDYLHYNPRGIYDGIPDDAVMLKKNALLLKALVDGPRCCPRFTATLTYTWDGTKLSLSEKPHKIGLK